MKARILKAGRAIVCCSTLVAGSVGLTLGAEIPKPKPDFPPAEICRSARH